MDCRQHFIISVWVRTNHYCIHLMIFCHHPLPVMPPPTGFSYIPGHTTGLWQQRKNMALRHCKLLLLSIKTTASEGGHLMSRHVVAAAWQNRIHIPVHILSGVLKGMGRGLFDRTCSSSCHLCLFITKITVKKLQHSNNTSSGMQLYGCQLTEAQNMFRTAAWQDRSRQWLISPWESIGPKKFDRQLLGRATTDSVHLTWRHPYA